MKRVLIFSLTYHPYVGGAELAIEEITGRLARGRATTEGIDPVEFHFDVITLRFNRALPRIEDKGNVTIHRIGFATDAPEISDRSMPFRCKVSKILFPFTSFFKALSLNRRYHYDLIWAMMANQAGFGALFFKLMHSHIPYMLELQDGNTLAQVRARQPLLRFVWPLYKKIYLNADMIKVISSSIKDLAREIGYDGPVVVIPNAVDTKKFSGPIPEKALLFLKEALDKQAGDVFLFTASRLVLSRGVEDVIRALSFLSTNVKFIIAGEGEDREKLRMIARDMGVLERVRFLGHIEHNSLPIYFKVSDIFVRPSVIEGFGSAFVEAFAAGIPVIATPVGGIPDFLQDGVTGLFCEVRNPESIARAAKRYLDNPALVAKVVKNARELVMQKYDWNIIARDMKERVLNPLIKV